MFKTNALARTAGLVGEPARANMLLALMDGRALTATELAHAAAITPQTASGHLARLTEAGLLTMVRAGRHRYHRLASSQVAAMLESIMAVSVVRGGNGAAASLLRVGPRDKVLRQARTCYDHMAGQFAVALADRMVALGYVTFSGAWGSDDDGTLSGDGVRFLQGLHVDLAAGESRGGKRHGTGNTIACRPCLDWSERRPHIAGRVGRALCQGFFAQGWVRRVGSSRAITITPAGRVAVARAFGPGVLP